MLNISSYFKRDDYLSLDFSESSLKMAKANTTDATVEVEFSDREGITGLSDDNRVDKYTEALQSLLGRNSISSGQPVAFALPTNSVIVRKLELPRMSEQRLNDVIQYEAESHIPFPLEEVKLDYQILEHTEDQTLVLLVVVKNDKLQEFLRVIENTQLRPEIIEISAFSLFNLYQHFQTSTDGKSERSPKALVDVGRNETDIIIFQGDTFYYARSVSAAGDAVTEEISEQLGVDLEQAEQLKIEHGNLPLSDTPESDATGEKPPPPSDTASDEAPPPPPDSEKLSESEEDSKKPPPPPGTPSDESTEESEASLTSGPELGTSDDPPTDSEADGGGISEAPDPGESPAGEQEDTDELNLTLGTDDQDDSETSQQPPPPPNQEDTSETSSEATGTEDTSPEDPPPDESENELTLGQTRSPGSETHDPDDTQSGETDDGPTDDDSVETEPDIPPTESDLSDESLSLGQSRDEDVSDAEPETSSEEEVVSDDSGDDAESEDGDELDLSLGQKRTPDSDNSESSLKDPFEEEEDENSGDTEDDDSNDLSLGAAANPDSDPPPPPEVDQEALQEAIVSQVDRLIGEIRQTLDYFRNEMNGDEIDEILLCGDGSKLRNLPAYVEEHFSHETSRYEPLAQLKGIPETELQTMMVAAGLQLRSGQSDPAVTINLLPDEIVQERNARQRNRKLLANGALAGVLLLQIIVWVFYSYRVRQSYFEKSQEELSVVQPIVNRVNQLKQTRDKLNQRITVLRNLQKNQVRLLPIIHELDQLEAPLRDRTWFTSYSYSGGDPYGTLKLTGVTGDFQDVSDIYQWLDRMEFTVGQQSENQTRKSYKLDGNEQSMVKFTVTYQVTFEPINESLELASTEGSS